MGVAQNLHQHKGTGFEMKKSGLSSAEQGSYFKR